MMYLQCYFYGGHVSVDGGVDSAIVIMTIRSKGLYYNGVKPTILHYCYIVWIGVLNCPIENECCEMRILRWICEITSIRIE